jgi:uncharacterized protein (TIGR03083 family)
MMDTHPIWQHVDTERAWMADLLESLPEEDWDRPSLCDGWTVRDVGAHLTFAQSSIREVLGPMVRAGFRYDVFVRDSARRSPLTHEEIVAKIRSFLGSRKRVAFVTDLEPLIDILVHNQDIARPLGVDHPIPAEAAAAAADRVLSTPWPIRQWKSPRGVRLVATDTDWSYGSGREVRAPMGSHLMFLTGRQTLPAAATAHD